MTSADAPPAPAYACPHCRTGVVAGTEVCPTCGMRFTGPDAVRLWQVHQQILRLQDEEKGLVQRLLLPAEAAAALDRLPGAGAGPAVGAAVNPYPAPPSAAPGGPHRRRGLSGQQVLFALGALMLLSAASFFLAVVWFVVGIVGQALIMVALTGAAVAGTALATRRGLPGAAETAAVVATGLLLIDLSAAHSLGLAGLDRLPTATWWSIALPLAGALLLVWDRLVPREQDGRPLRPVAVFRPAAVAALAAAPWAWLAALDPGRTATVVALAGAVLVESVLLAAAVRLDPPSRSGRAAVAAGVAAVAAGLALVLHLVTGLAVVYDPEGVAVTRYALLPLLLLWPVAVAVASRLPATSRYAASAPLLAALLAGPVLAVPFLDLPWPVLIGASAVAAVVVGLAALRRAPSRWTAAALGLVLAAQPLLLALVVIAGAAGTSTVFEVLRGEPGGAEPSYLLLAVPGALWAATTGVLAARRRHAGWAVVAQGALLATALVAAEALDGSAWGLFLVLAVAQVALARQVRVVAAGAAGAGGTGASVVEASALVLATVHGTLAASTAEALEPWVLTMVLAVLGVATVVYASAPGRLRAAYVGTLLLTAAVVVQLEEAGVDAVEAWSLPLAAMLALVGAVEHRRDPAAPTALTTGPALSVLVGPTLLVAVGEGDALRLALVTLVATVLTVLGVQRGWRAPVTVGGAALVVLAVTQGGPLVAYVPGWILLGWGGAVLLTAAVLFERAVVTGRRAASWYAHLR